MFCREVSAPDTGSIRKVTGERPSVRGRAVAPLPRTRHPARQRGPKEVASPRGEAVPSRCAGQIRAALGGSTSTRTGSNVVSGQIENAAPAGTICTGPVSMLREANPGTENPSGSSSGSGEAGSGGAPRVGGRVSTAQPAFDAGSGDEHPVATRYPATRKSSVHAWPADTPRGGRGSATAPGRSVAAATSRTIEPATTTGSCARAAVLGTTSQRPFFRVIAHVLRTGNRSRSDHERRAGGGPNTT